MRRQYFLSLIILFIQSAFALEPHTANYQLSINGLKIAEEVRTLHKIDDQYFYTANAKTTGVAALVKDYSISASSTFTKNQRGVDSINYQIIEQEDQKFSKNYAIDVHSENSIVRSILTKAQPKVVNWQSKKGNIVDPLSLFLALSFDIKNNPDALEFNYQVADGKSIQDHTYQHSKNQTLTINDKTLLVSKVEKTNSNNKLTAFFSYQHNFLPVLILQKKSGKDYEYKLINLKNGKTKTQTLQISF